jgi:DNA mismatch repair protein MutL
MTHRAQIRPLADHVIDQIAAGEVVERPASIVKELIENSLDAGASRITIELDEGGIERILVRDDGYGIPPDELPRAVLRHYTSKLTAAEELTAIGSLGFRGEALASIAAVTEFTLVSKTVDQAHGWQLRVTGGEALAPPQPAPHGVGTTVEASRLFAAVPARRQFLKRPRTELLQIQQLVRRAGFCYPAVGFRLLHDGRQSLWLPPVGEAGATTRRWRALFGAEFCRHRVRVEVESAGLRLGGWVGESDFSRQNADLQYVAVNGRIVRDRNIAHAVRMAYASGIPDGRHAAYALHLEVPRASVDVNVHPGKTEVRFRDVRAVHDFVFGAVRGALSEAAASPPRYPDQGLVPRAAVAESHGPGSTRSPRARGAGLPKPVEPAATLMTIAFDRYAIVEQARELCVIDLQAAIARVVEQRLVAGECSVRPLIIPESVAGALSDDELDGLGTVGVDLQRFGDNRLVLRGVPLVTSDIDPAVFARELLRQIGIGSTPHAAVAASAALAFTPPPGLTERRAWFATLERHFAQLDIPRAAVVAVPDASWFAALFAGATPQ